MGGVSARFADGEAVVCAEHPRMVVKHTTNVAKKNPFIFMGNVLPEPVADWYFTL